MPEISVKPYRVYCPTDSRHSYETAQLGDLERTSLPCTRCGAEMVISDRAAVLDELRSLAGKLQQAKEHHESLARVAHEQKQRVLTAIRRGTR